MLALAPLAGIAHIARLALADGGMVAADAWRVIALCLVCLFAGMALVSAGELVAHLADNRLTHGLRLSAMQRLARVPLGWFTERASGQVKQAMQDDVATLHELTAHFYTTVEAARARWPLLRSTWWPWTGAWPWSRPCRSASSFW